MALESANYISQLVTTNPDGQDQRYTADDHMRLIKKAVKQTFPNLNSAVNLNPADFSRLDGLTSTAQNQINSLWSSVGANQDRIAVLSAGGGGSGGLSDTASAALVSHSATLAAHSANLSTISANLDTVESKVATHSANLSTISGDLDTVESKVATHSANLSTISADLDTVEATVADHETRITSLEGSAPGGTVSFVLARRTAVFSASASAVVKYDSVVEDYKGEYKTAKGTFVPSTSGVYAIDAKLHFPGGLWSQASIGASMSLWARIGLEHYMMDDILIPTCVTSDYALSGSLTYPLDQSQTVVLYIRANPDMWTKTGGGSNGWGSYVTYRRI